MANSTGQRTGKNCHRSLDKLRARLLCIAARFPHDACRTLQHGRARTAVRTRAVAAEFDGLKPENELDSRQLAETREVREQTCRSSEVECDMRAEQRPDGWWHRPMTTLLALRPVLAQCFPRLLPAASPGASSFAVLPPAAGLFPVHMKHLLAAAVAATFALVTIPLPAEAGALSSAVRGALAKRAAVPPPMAFGKRAFGKPRDVVIQRSRHPQAAAHIEHAQKNGQPSILHIDRAGAAKRRQQAIGTVNRERKPAPGYQRDEFPPAFTKEGGSNSNVRWIRQKDNAGAGSTMRWQTRDLPDGSKIRILVK